MQKNEDPNAGKVSLEETISKIEKEFREHERKEAAVAEKLFYDYLRLPEKANAIKFFDKIKAEFEVKAAIYIHFIHAHRDDEEKCRNYNTTGLLNVDAYYAYHWLRNLNPLKVIDIDRMAGDLLNQNCLQKYVEKLDREIAIRLAKYYRKQEKQAYKKINKED